MAGLEARNLHQVGTAFEMHTSGITVQANSWALAETVLTKNYPNSRHRTTLVIFNNSSDFTLFIGASGQSTSNLFPITPQGLFSIDLREATSNTFGTDVFMYANGGQIDVRVIELA